MGAGAPEQGMEGWLGKTPFRRHCGEFLVNILDQTWPRTYLLWRKRSISYLVRYVSTNLNLFNKMYAVTKSVFFRKGHLLIDFAGIYASHSVFKLFYLLEILLVIGSITRT